jgi:acetyltransferase-like isoleucine patch superfamily enzyme
MNVTMEAEHFPEVDRERFARRKPLLWFWQMFDRSPLGLNHWLGLRFRCMLGRHIFEHLGSGVKIYHGVDLTYGYNLSIGDGAVIRQRALLNDRGGIKIGKAPSSVPTPASIPSGTTPRTTRRSAFSPRSSAKAPTSPATQSCSPARTSPPAHR